MKLLADLKTRFDGGWWTFGSIIKTLGICTTAAAMLVLSGCDSSTEDDAGTGESDGSVHISLTDAEGDFLSYTVEVSSLSLTRKDGTVVETLPITTEIDFSQYVEMTEFLTAATIPSGIYVKGEMTLDFSNAKIWVENADGDAVEVSGENIVDESGTPVTTITVNVALEDRNQLLIGPGIPANLNLDFDLNSSNLVVFNDAVPTVEVSPVLIADVELDEQKPHRARGPLKSVDLDASNYEIYIRPFRHRLIRDQRFGSLTITVTDETVFDINGVGSEGLSGLTELSTQPDLTATIAIGEIKFDPRRFEATEVYAGSSVPGGDQDVIAGVVVARSGDELTVKGATIYRSSGSIYFGGQQLVTLSDDTAVKKQLSMTDDTLDIDDISVGQRVRIFGQYDPANEVMDASEGTALMLLTTITGSVVTVENDDKTLVADLSSIVRTRIAAFDFSGTGASSEVDADPDNYELNLTSLLVDGFTENTPFQARGFVQPFGEAPEDFDVHTIFSIANKPGVLVAHWRPASTSAVDDVNEDSITIVLDGSEHFYNLTQGLVRVKLGEGETDVKIVPMEADNGPYIITQKQGGSVNHRDFGAFTADLKKRLDEGAAVRGMTSPGVFDRSALTMTIKSIVLRLE